LTATRKSTKTLHRIVLAADLVQAIKVFRTLLKLQLLALCLLLGGSIHQRIDMHLMMLRVDLSRQKHDHIALGIVW
jgi:hypothetical protein